MDTQPGIGVPAFRLDSNLAVVRLQAISAAWMLLECSISFYGAWQAHSVVLIAFGADSFVELVSAVVVWLAFSPRLQISRRRAAGVAGILLYVLAAVICPVALLAWKTGIRPGTSRAGIVIVIAALLGMPVLAWQKRRLSRLTESRALAADSVQSATCAWLAAAALAGLIADTTLHLRWVDSLAAIAVLPLLIVEAQKAMRGESCGCGSAAAH